MNIEEFTNKICNIREKSEEDYEVIMNIIEKIREIES